MPDESEIAHQLGILSGKLDMVLENQRNVMNQIDHLELRIRSLESHRGYLLGMIAAAAMAWTFIFEFIKIKVFNG
jgi:hypothetical protein